MSDAGTGVDLPDNMITTTDMARLTALGIRVAAAPVVGLPPINVPGSRAVLVSDMGTVGTLHVDWHHGAVRLHVNPICKAEIEEVAQALWGTLAGRALPARLLVDDYLRVFEALAAHLAGQDISRAQMGNAWAVYCYMALPPHNSRNLKQAARTVSQLHNAGVAPALFYETLQVTPGARVLARATAASIFRHAHPQLHGSLAQDLFT